MTLRNFNAAWCRDRGTTNVKKDSVLTLMKGEPHKLAMKLENESEFMKQPVHYLRMLQHQWEWQSQL